MVMYLKAFRNATIIDSQTAGADEGNISLK
ncbi:hypothetical protein C8C85_2031 [Flavobacterium sp. 103]|nr:hypothetical protein C8C85_2031 [Flavobacterium sp. 103]